MGQLMADTARTLRRRPLHPSSTRSVWGEFSARYVLCTSRVPVYVVRQPSSLVAPRDESTHVTRHRIGHLEVAAALGADISRARAEDAGAILADRITWYMQQLGVPNGLRAVGYTAADIPALVEGTMLQQRLTKLSPRPAGPEDLAALFEAAL